MMVLASFICGLIFGFGLLISGMTQPSKVLGFLDVFGQWDPTLGFVMAAALGVSGVGFSLLRQRTKPVLASALIASEASPALAGSSSSTTWSSTRSGCAVSGFRFQKSGTLSAPATWTLAG